MLDRRACERRVYRLATLLTGNPNAATRVISSVIDAQPDLRKLDGAHMDRLTVLRSREIASAMIVDAQLPAQVAAAISSLTAQQREAWVFVRLYEVSEREAARAMDCSTAAARMHLDQADAALGRHLGADVGRAAEILVSYSMSLDVPRFHRRTQERRRRRRIIRRLILVGIACGFVIAFVLLWPRIAALLEQLA